jgi:signal transduction histidine kinase
VARLVVGPGSAAVHRRGVATGALGARVRLSPRYLQGIAALVAAYYAAAHVGYAYGFSGPVASVVWLPVGVAAAFLYRAGLRFWPGVVIGDLLVNNYATLPLGSAFAQSVGNLLEVLVIAALARRACPRDDPIASLRSVVGLALAIAAGTLLSATIGSVAAWLGSVIDGHSLPYVWRTWWLGDFSGALIVLPLALSWSTLPARPWPRLRVLEAALMVGLVAGLSALQLGGTTKLVALVFPALIWATLRFGQRGATVATTIVCGFAVWGATNHLGPFGVGTIGERLLDTQLFIATVSLSALAIAALVAERTRLAAGIQASRARLVAASDETRRAIERDLHDGAQQDLIGLRLKLALAADLVEDDPVEGKRLVNAVARQMEDVVESVRSIAAGAYPALLHERGLTEALRSTALRCPSPVSFRATAIEHLPEPVEVAVYFCCLEALQNVAKHAGRGAHAIVRLWHEPGALGFEIADTGVGFDSGAVRAGNGLSNMHDRIETISGSLSVTSRPGSGTTVRGRVPIP